ncbi:melanoma-associated antigen D2 [Oncorhynchus keta]|uniref:melanoma-associated antigen D2 n=1 Tax=Oncorhynchus keta TaxID=8018 RepID=UPI00227D201D|nr:melanoma-associated antigen D2 [Oncorhynchus keta]
MMMVTVGGNMVTVGGNMMMVTVGGNMVTVGGNMVTVGGNMMMVTVGGNMVTVGGNMMMVTVGGNMMMVTVGGNMVTVGGNMVTVGGNMVTVGGNMVTVGGNMVTVGGNIVTVGGNMVTVGGNMMMVTVGGNMVTVGGNMMMVTVGGNMVTVGGNIVQDASGDLSFGAVRAVMSQRKRASNTQSSQNKGVRSQRWEAVLGDDEDDPSFTQPSTSQVQKGLDRLTPAQVDLKTAEVVQFIFVKDQKKFPIRRAGVQEHLSEIIKRVGSVFETVFGLKLVEIDSKNHVYPHLEQLFEGESLNMSPSNPKTGLLFVILSIVFMKGGVVKESMVWNTLKKLRVDQGERHEIFGDVKKVKYDEFVRQRYLEYVRIPHTEPLEFEFRWGQRADMEVSKVKLLEFIGQLHEQDPQSWTQQYREATAPPAAPAVVTSANTSASVSQR